MAESKFEHQEVKRLALTIQGLRAGEFTGLLPEFYELREAVENSEDMWHQQEPVFDHTLSVMEALEGIFADNTNLETLFNKKIDTYTRKELLEIATAFHDIGKKEAMVKEGEFTKCAGHEEIGVGKTKIILKRFNLSEKETQLVLKIIANHSVFHHLSVADNKNLSADLERLKGELGELYPDLVVLSYADTKNSKLSQADPEKFKKYIDFYQEEIEKL